MTPGGLRELLVSRAESGAGVPHADHLLGVEGAQRTIGAHAFEVRLGRSDPLPSRQRTHTADSHYVRREVEVRVLSAGNPARGAEQWDAAEEVELRLRRSLLTRATHDDGLDCVSNAIVWLGTDPPLYLDGGSYRLATLRFHVSYVESLQ